MSTLQRNLLTATKIVLFTFQFWGLARPPSLTRAEGAMNVKDLKMPSPTTSVVSSPSIDPQLKTKLVHFKHYWTTYVGRERQAYLTNNKLGLYILGMLFYYY